MNKRSAKDSAVRTTMDPYMTICALRNFFVFGAQRNEWTRYDLFQAVERWRSDACDNNPELRRLPANELVLRTEFHESIGIPHVRSEENETVVEVPFGHATMNVATVNSIVEELKRTGSVNMQNLRRSYSAEVSQSTQRAAYRAVAAFPIMVTASIIAFVWEAEIFGLSFALAAAAAGVTSIRALLSSAAGDARSV